MYRRIVLSVLSLVICSGSMFADTIGPLIEGCDWGEYTPYNKYVAQICGEDDVYLGYGGVALARIMFYYTSPNRPLRTVSYIDSLNSLHGEYSTYVVAWHDYDWINMPEYLTSESPSNQMEAVCQLLFQASVALHTDFERYHAEINTNA